MDASSLQYRLTEEERRAFNETGYFIVENALSPEQVTLLTAEVDRIYDNKMKEGHDPQKALFYTDFVKDHQLFLDLVDYGKVLPKVWDILGWNIYMYHTHMIVTPPSGLEKSDKTFGWHQDSGRVNLEMESHPRPRLSLKVAYFLSDLSEPGRGNFWIVHTTPNAERSERANPYHLAEYTLAELLAMLSASGFRPTGVWGQHWALGARIFRGWGFRRIAWEMERRNAIWRPPVPGVSPRFWCVMARRKSAQL